MSKLQEITGRFLQVRHSFAASDPSQPPTQALFMRQCSKVASWSPKPTGEVRFLGRMLGIGVSDHDGQ